jgi:hypothetical protein
MMDGAQEASLLITIIHRERGFVGKNIYAHVWCVITILFFKKIVVKNRHGANLKV